MRRKGYVCIHTWQLVILAQLRKENYKIENYDNIDLYYHWLSFSIYFLRYAYFTLISINRL